MGWYMRDPWQDPEPYRFDYPYDFDYSVYDSFTLEARWKFPFTVSFDANGGEGTMEDQKFTYGEDQELSENKFTRKGYDFDGWIAYD